MEKEKKLKVEDETICEQSLVPGRVTAFAHCLLPQCLQCDGVEFLSV